MTASLKGAVLYLGPRGRAAPDRVREALMDVIASGGRTRVASQQIFDEQTLAGLFAATLDQHRVDALLEYDYLLGRETGDVWHEAGKREPNRRALLAMLRAEWKVGTDRSSHLQHANLIVREGDAGGSLALTSANISPGSLDEHYNWAATSRDTAHIRAAVEAFDQAADGDFSDIEVVVEETPERASLCISSTGGVVTRLAAAFEEAQEAIEIAYFNISGSSDLAGVLASALSRGVAVTGLVDGDQSGQPWDAVPALRSAGADVRYYPGQLTGARGRMHYKMAVVDHREVHVGTANLSSAAHRSLELGMTCAGDPDAPGFVAAEITRLHSAASVSPL